VEVRILEDKANPLLKRHELRFEVAHATAATPSRDAVRGELSKLVKAPKDRVIIERMHARYGTAVTRGDAMVYDSAEAAKAIVRSHILVRNGLKEKPAKGPAPAAASAPAPVAPVAPAAPAAAEPSPPEKKE
jgi:small subunit ribosomal protein S24e